MKEQENIMAKCVGCERTYYKTKGSKQYYCAGCILSRKNYLTIV